MKKSLFALLLSLTCHLSFAQDLLSQKKTDRLYKSGIDLMGRNEYGAALKNFEDFLGQSPREDVRREDAGYYQALCALYLFHADGEKKMDDFLEAHASSPHAVAAHYDLGNFFYSEKNHTRASAEYEKVDFSALSADQQNVGRFRYGYSLFNLKKLKESLDQFNFIKTSGGQYGPAASYYAGFIEFGNGEWEAAMIDLRRAEQNASYSKVVPYMIAQVYYKQKQYDELLKYIASVKDREGLSNPEEMALLSAEAQFRMTNYKDALTGYQLFLKDKTGADRGVLYRAGYSAYSIGQDKIALDYFKSSASDKDSVGFYSSYYLGSLYLKQQQKPLALTAFDNARKMKSDARLAEESTYQYAKVSYDLGYADRAISEFEKFIPAYPASQYLNEVKELLTQAYLNANNYNKAIEYVESLSSRSPAMQRVYQKAAYLKGAELFNKDDYAQAVLYFERSVSMPVDVNIVADANVWCGEAYSIGKKYPEAIRKYEANLNLPGYSNQEVITRTRYGLGYAYYNQQKYDRALVSFREFATQGAKGTPNYSDGILRLADCYYVTKAYADALTTYKKAIQFNTTDPDYAHLQMAIILGIQSKYAEATAELDVVLKTYPQSRYLDEAIFQRGQFYFEQSNYALAVVEYTRLIDANKPSRFLPYAYQRRAAAYFNLKDYKKTAADYEAVVDKFPTHPIAKGVLLPLQEALTLSGQTAELDKYMKQVKEASSDTTGLELIEFEAAKNLYFNQDYARAITGLTNFISSHPDSPRKSEASYYQAESLYRMKDINGALKIYAELEGDNTFTFANKVISRLAELEFKQGSFEKAVPHFRLLAKNATTKKDQSTAWLGLMESFFLLNQYDSADAYAHLVLEKGKVNAGTENKASLFLGKSAMARGDYDGAKDEFLSTLNSARDEYGAEAKYLLAEILHLNKDYKACYETLVGLNTDFAEYTDWVGKSYLLMADNYLAMGETFQAKGTLKSLIDNFPVPTIKDIAREKLKKIESDELKKQVPSDTTDTKKN